jgi:hypothetical protein
LAEGLEFTWNLIDQVSRSATAIERALLKAEAAMKHAQGTARGGSSSWAFMGLKMGAVAGIASEVTRRVFGAGEAVLKLGVSGVKFALEAASFRENSILALEAIMGSRSAAVQAMDAWGRLSEKTPFDNREVQEWGKQLVVAGESLQNSMTILRAAADLGTALGSTTEKRQAIGQSFVEWAAGIKQLGSMADSRRLRELSQFGISPQKAQQNLAARLTGGNVGALQKLMEQARATGQDLSHEIVLAALQAAQDTYGKIGALGVKGADTLSGLATKIDFDDIFKGLERSKGYSALKDVLRNLSSILSGRGGKAFHDAMMDLANALGAALAPLTGEEGRKNMEAFMLSLIDLTKQLIPMVSATAGYINDIARSGIWEATMNRIDAHRTPVEAEHFRTLGDLYRAHPEQAPASGPGPGITRPTLTNYTTIHVHGNADTDNLVEKIDTQTQESFTAFMDRLGLMAGAQ